MFRNTIFSATADGYLMPFCAVSRMDLTDAEMDPIEEMCYINDSIDLDSEEFLHMWINLHNYPDFANKNEKQWFNIGDWGLVKFKARIPMRHTGSIIYMPLSYIKDLREDDELSVQVPLELKSIYSTPILKEKISSAKLMLHIRLRQLTSRYANLGSFESAMKSLT